MVGDNAQMNYCLDLLQMSKLPKIEKLKLEVQIRRAKYALSGCDLAAATDIRKLLDYICREIVALCSKQRTDNDVNGLIALFSYLTDCTKSLQPPPPQRHKTLRLPFVS